MLLSELGELRFGYSVGGEGVVLATHSGQGVLVLALEGQEHLPEDYLVGLQLPVHIDHLCFDLVDLSEQEMACLLYGVLCLFEPVYDLDLFASGDDLVLYLDLHPVYLLLVLLSLLVLVDLFGLFLESTLYKLFLLLPHESSLILPRALREVETLEGLYPPEH